MNNLCGLVVARISASENDLPVMTPENFKILNCLTKSKFWGFWGEKYQTQTQNPDLSLGIFGQPNPHAP